MAIVGRDLDVSERKVSFQWSNQFGGQSLTTDGGVVIATGTTLFMFMIPFPCTLQSGAVYAQGISGAPEFSLKAMRWASGATAISVGISNMVVGAFGTSGVQGLSGLPPAGSTLLSLFTGDVMIATTAGANTAIKNLLIELVVVKTQDIVAYNRVST